MWGLKMTRFGLLSAAVFLAAASGAPPAQAQEGVLTKSILGAIGIIPDERPEIEYRERAPLVLPPSMELPPPAAPGAAHVRAPDWPQDPDVTARRREAAAALVPETETERRRMSSRNPRLSVDELRSGRRAGAEVPQAPVVRLGDNVREGLLVHPDVLRAQGAKQEEELSGGTEPVRRTLTDPPTAYRRSPTGQPIRRATSSEPVTREDEADPMTYIRQQQQRY